MYKITLFDNNCVGFVSGTFRCFTEDIEDFKNRWFLLEKDEKTKDRFLRSLNGEIIADYYCNDPELNIVQILKDYVEFGRKNFEFEDKDVVLHNTWGSESIMKVRHISIEVLWTHIDGIYVKIGKYRIQGAAMYDDEFEETPYFQVSCYGNSILETKSKFGKYSTNELNYFDDDSIESIVYLPCNFFDSKEELEKDMLKGEISDDEIDCLLCDILGEAG